MSLPSVINDVAVKSGKNKIELNVQWVGAGTETDPNAHSN